MNLYTTSLIKEASKAGFKCGTVLFRGAAGLKLTSGKLCCSASRDDAGVVIRHVYSKYIKSNVESKKTRLYTYGVSLGAMVLGDYLIKTKDDTKEMIDAALLYATPWDYFNGYHFFFTNCYGLYAWGIG